MKYCENYQNVTQRYKLTKCCWKNGANRLDPYWVATSTIFFKPWNVCKAQQSKMQENKACLYSSFGKLYAQESPENLLLLYFHSWVSQVWVQHQCSMSLNHRSVKALQSLSYQNRGKELALHLLPPHGTHNTYGNSCLWYSLPLPTLYQWNQESREWLLRHFQFRGDLILEFHIF